MVGDNTVEEAQGDGSDCTALLCRNEHVCVSEGREEVALTPRYRCPEIISQNAIPRLIHSPLHLFQLST